MPLLAMTRSSPPRLASLGMLLWATSSAMPIDSSPSNEADGPAAHELSLQPVGRGADLDLERWKPKTCRGQQCCTNLILNSVAKAYRGRDVERCEDITYDDAGRNCHKYFYRNRALPPRPRPRTRCALRRAREVLHAVPRRCTGSLPTVPQPEWYVWSLR